MHHAQSRHEKTSFSICTDRLSFNRCPCSYPDHASRLLPHWELITRNIQCRSREYRAASVAGHLSQAIDKSNLGKYFFEVRDQNTKQVLYSRGFASIYGEWETTDEAKTVNRTFQESLRFPAPTSPVEIVLKKRDARNVFQDIWTTTIDPADQFIDRAKQVAPAPVITIQKTGDPETKVDFLILGDGYTAAEKAKFEADARRLTETLFSTSPFKENRRKFNVWGLCPPAAESGISRPSTGSIAITR